MTKKADRSHESFNAGTPLTPSGVNFAGDNSVSAAIDNAHPQPDGPWDSMGRVNPNYQPQQGELRSLREPPVGMRRLSFVPEGMRLMKRGDVWGKVLQDGVGLMPSPDSKPRTERFFGEAPLSPAPPKPIVRETIVIPGRRKFLEYNIPDPTMDKLQGHIGVPDASPEASQPAPVQPVGSESKPKGRRAKSARAGRTQVQ